MTFDLISNPTPNQARHSLRSFRTGLLALTLGLALVACASPQQPPDDPTARSAETSAQPSEQAYGDDPMGLAHQWTADLPGSAPDSLRSTVESWSDPTVLRLYRHSETETRAVVAASDHPDGDAILLTLTRPAPTSSWQVDSAKPTQPTHAWPTN